MDDKNAVILLTALAQEHRLRIFRLLVKCGPSGMPAMEIASAIGISPTSTSFHLNELDRAGLLHSTREGRFIRYAVNVDTMRGLLVFLTKDCCQGRPDLCGDFFAKAKDVCVCEEEKP